MIKTLSKDILLELQKQGLSATPFGLIRNVVDGIVNETRKSTT